MDRRQACASAAKQLTATSDWLYIPWHQAHPLTATSDRFFYRHKRLKTETAILPPRAIRP